MRVKVIDTPSGEALGCMWFASCEQPATVAVPHPIFTHVPACADCARRAGHDPATLPLATLDTH